MRLLTVYPKCRLWSTGFGRPPAAVRQGPACISGLGPGYVAMAPQQQLVLGEAPSVRMRKQSYLHALDTAEGISAS